MISSCSGIALVALVAVCVTSAFGQVISARPALEFNNKSVSQASVPTAKTTPAISVGPSALNFGTVAVGDKSSVMYAELRNNGTQTVQVSSIAATGDFAIGYNTCGASIAAGAKCVVGVTFSPKASGVLTGNIDVH